MPRACWQEGGEQQRVLSLHQPQRLGAWGEGVVQNKRGAGAPQHHAEPPSLSHCFLLNPSLRKCKLSLLDWKKKEEKKKEFGPVPAHSDGIVDWHLAATLEQTSYLGGGCVGVREVHNVTQAFLITDTE